MTEYRWIVYNTVIIEEDENGCTEFAPAIVTTTDYRVELTGQESDTEILTLAKAEKIPALRRARIENLGIEGDEHALVIVRRKDGYPLGELRRMGR